MRGVRPGNIIEIAGDEDRDVPKLLYLCGNHQQLGIPHIGVYAIAVFVLLSCGYIDAAVFLFVGNIVLF
jgi:hypothetical protein